MEAVRRALGLQNEQRAAILCSTRYEWVVCDIGINAAAGATTTIYPQNLPDECAYIIQDSNTQFVFAENDEQAAKLQSVKAQIPSVKKVIVIDGKASGDWIITLSDLQKLGEPSSQADWEAVCRSVKPTDLATLIYTSGTTGVSWCFSK